MERKLSVNEIAVGLTAITEYCNAFKIQMSELKESDLEIIDNDMQSIIKYDKYQFNKSIKKQVVRLLNKYADQNIIFGIRIVKEEKIADSNSHVYYASLPINTVHINLIADFLSGYPYIDRQILTVLNSFVCIYNRKKYQENNTSKYADIFYNNLCEISKALSMNRPMRKNSVLSKWQQSMSYAEYERFYSKPINMIQFSYSNEDNKGNSISNLIISNPVQLLWVQGHYCLEAYNDVRKTKTLYRIDKMYNVQCLNEEAILPINHNQ